MTDYCSDIRRTGAGRAIILALLAFFGALAALAPARAQPRGDLVEARLLLEPSAIQAGVPFTAAVQLQMKPGWHTYWLNPGDSGLPTEIRWKLPPGFTAGPIQWPTPERLAVGPLMNFGYEGEATLLVEITPPATLPASGRVDIGADVSWLACEKECIPGSATLDASAPLAPALAPAAPDAGAAPLFARARDALPKPLAGATFAAAARTLTVRAPLPAGAGAGDVRSAVFFPAAEGLIDNAAPQQLAVAEGALTLTAPRAEGVGAAGSVPQRLEGVIAIAGPNGATQGYAISATPDAALAPAAPAPAASAGGDGDGGGQALAAAALPPPPVNAEGLTLLTAMLFAFMGGVILNLMPCVFPVLSIKALSLARGGGGTPAKMRLHGLSYGAGVLAAFAALAAALMAARAAGASAGWGFQLQSPVVVAALACVMLAMGLGLSGVVHFGARFAGAGDRLTHGHGYAASFFTGVLAAVVASPCTGPFMGAAIGFSLTQPPAVTAAVFLALGAGLAAPFVLLAFAPALARALPRPGRWMDVLKQALAFPLYGTAAWLVWVLSRQASPLGLAMALSALVATAFACWASAVAAQSGRAGAMAGRAGAVAALAVAALCVAQIHRPGDAPAGAAAAGAGAETYSAQRLDALLQQDRPVFVNLTAAWCITCMVNERTTLERAGVRDAMARRGVVYMTGDWTSRNPEITALLARFGRGGVPLYLLYPGRNGAPQVLPQILTPGMVIAAIDALPTRAAAAR